MRCMNKLESPDSTTLCADSDFQKLGQPVPDSNLVFESNNAVSQQMQWYRPAAWLFQYSPEKGRSVPACRVTTNASADNCSRHCASVLTTRAISTTPVLFASAENNSILTVAGAAAVGAALAPFLTVMTPAMAVNPNNEPTS